MNHPGTATVHPDTHAFMHALFGAVAEDSGLVTPLWTLQNKRSHWHPAHDVDGLAATAATAAADNRDVYVSVSASSRLPNESRRGATRITADNSAGIVGLWADIDIADPDVHKKWNLPPDEKSARLILERMGLTPSVVVNSGHGLQAWWLLHEFEVFDNDDDRRRAATIAERWNRTMAVHAAKGPDGGDGSERWTVDMTFDLSRVMRIPGTLNRKGDPVVPVQLLELNPDRYTLDDFEDFCVDDSVLAAAGMRPTREYQTGHLILRTDAAITVETLDVLCEDARFEKTWERKRTDFADNSGSSYDMALAAAGINLGFDDQTIADLIIHFRRRHKDKPEKALRLDYMQRTISRARESAARVDAVEALDEVQDELVKAKESGDQEDTDTARRKALDVIGTQLGIEVTKIVRYMSEPPSFRLVTPTHTIEMGGPEEVRRMEKFATSVWSAVGVEIPKFKGPEWSRLMSVIPSAWIEQDIGFEATEQGETEMWLTAYLSVTPPVDTQEEAVDQQRPFYRNGRVAIFGDSFRRHTLIAAQERISMKEMGRRLTNYGCTRDTLAVKTSPQKRSTRSVWLLPTDWSSE